MPDYPTEAPEVKVPVLKGIDLRSGKNNLDGGEGDRVIGMYPRQDGQLSGMPGKHLLRVFDDNFYSDIPTGVEVLGTAQLFDGTGGIVVQLGAPPNSPLAGGSIVVLSLDELYGRVTGSDLTPGASPLEEALPYALLLHTATNGTNGGNLNAAGADNVFADGTLNSEASDTSGIVTLASNQFTLTTGIYRIRAFVTFGGPNSASFSGRARLFSVTAAAVATNYDTSTPIVGTVDTGPQNNTQNFPLVYLEGLIQVAGSEVFSIQMAGISSAGGGWFSQATAQGAASSVTAGSVGEVYKIVEIIQQS